MDENVKGIESIKANIDVWRSWLNEMKEIREANKGWYADIRKRSEPFLKMPSKDVNPEIGQFLLKRVILFQQNQHVANEMLFEGLTTVIVDLLELMVSARAVAETHSGIEQFKEDFRKFREDIEPILSLKDVIETVKKQFKQIEENSRQLRDDLPYG